MDSHHILQEKDALASTEARLARPVDIPNGSARGDLHSRGCSILSRTGLLFPIDYTPIGDRDLQPDDSAIPSRRGVRICFFRLKPVAVKWWERRELHPQGCQTLSLDPLLFGLNHLPAILAHPAELPPANSPFEAEDDYTFTTDAI